MRLPFLASTTPVPESEGVAKEKPIDGLSASLVVVGGRSVPRRDGEEGGHERRQPDQTPERKKSVTVTENRNHMLARSCHFFLARKCTTPLCLLGFALLFLASKLFLPPARPVSLH